MELLIKDTLYYGYSVLRTPSSLILLNYQTNDPRNNTRAYHSCLILSSPPSHRFLFHGDGRAVASHSQPPQGSTYDVPPPRSSVDAHSNSSHNKRGSNGNNSIPSGYSNHLLQRSRSQDHDSGYQSYGSERALEGPPVRLDKHPSIRRKSRGESSDISVARRGSSHSVQSPCSSFNERASEFSEPLFECDDATTTGSSSHTPHPDSPPAGDEAEVTGYMDADASSEGGTVIGGHMYDVVRGGGSGIGRSQSHPYYTPQSAREGGDSAVPTGDEYMCMIHPKSRTAHGRNGENGYVYMRAASSSSLSSLSSSQGSAHQSSTIPVPMPQAGGVNVGGDEYNTLQHFPNRQIASRVIDTQNYEVLPSKTLPTISEKGRRSTPPTSSKRDNYENHPLPENVKGLVPRHYRPSYENHLEGAFRGRRGSHGQESYENVHQEAAVAGNSNGNNNGRQRMVLQRQGSSVSCREQISQA